MILTAVGGCGGYDVSGDSGGVSTAAFWMNLELVIPGLLGELTTGSS